MTAEHIPQNATWLDTAASIIFNGGVVALAYETLFGVAADALNPDAAAKSAKVKERDVPQKGGKPISVILPSIDFIPMVTDNFSPLAQTLATKYWPGPLTLIVPAKSGLPPQLTSNDGYIGIRVPGESPALMLAKRTGKILTATSANPAGGTEPLSFEPLCNLDGIDLVIEGKVNGPPGSTIIKIDGNKAAILREGVIPLKESEL